jgi:hypothetical protein
VTNVAAATGPVTLLTAKIAKKSRRERKGRLLLVFLRVLCVISSRTLRSRAEIHAESEARSTHRGAVSAVVVGDLEAQKVVHRIRGLLRVGGDGEAGAARDLL